MGLFSRLLRHFMPPRIFVRTVLLVTSGDADRASKLFIDHAGLSNDQLLDVRVVGRRLRKRLAGSSADVAVSYIHLFASLMHMRSQMVASLSRGLHGTGSG